jgi:hypothetical protein
MERARRALATAVIAAAVVLLLLVPVVAVVLGTFHDGSPPAVVRPLSKHPEISLPLNEPSPLQDDRPTQLAGPKKGRLVIEWDGPPAAPRQPARGPDPEPVNLRIIWDSLLEPLAQAWGRAPAMGGAPPGKGQAGGVAGGASPQLTPEEKWKQEDPFGSHGQFGGGGAHAVATPEAGPANEAAPVLASAADQGATRSTVQDAYPRDPRPSAPRPSEQPATVQPPARPRPRPPEPPQRIRPPNLPPPHHRNPGYLNRLYLDVVRLEGNVKKVREGGKTRVVMRNGVALDNEALYRLREFLKTVPRNQRPHLTPDDYSFAFGQFHTQLTWRETITPAGEPDYKLVEATVRKPGLVLYGGNPLPYFARDGVTDPFTQNDFLPSAPIGNGTLVATPVPEPAAGLLMAAFSAMFLAPRRRSRPYRRTGGRPRDGGECHNSPGGGHSVW